MHLRVRNRFATHPDVEPDEAEDLGKLEAELAGDLQRVLSALRRSAYAPPPRLAPVEEFHAFRQSRAGRRPIEAEPAPPGRIAFDPGLNPPAPSRQGRRGRKRYTVRLLAATAAALGLAVIIQSPVHQAFGLGESVEEAKTVAIRAISRIIEAVPDGVVIVVESAAELLRGRIDGLPSPGSNPIDTPAAGARESTGPQAAAPEAWPALVSQASPPTQPELSPTNRSVDGGWLGPERTSPSDNGESQPAILSAAEFRAVSRSEDKPAAPDRIAPPPVRRLMPAEDGTPALSVQPSMELSAIGPTSMRAVGLRGSMAQSSSVQSGGRSRAVSMTQPASSTVKATVNMRAGPDNDASIIAVVAAGSRVYVTSCKFWCAVVFDGKQGWIYNEFIEGAGPSDRPGLSDGSRLAESHRRCERGWRASVSNFIRQGFVADDAKGGPNNGGERC